MKDGTKKLIPAQQVILCAGQESEIALKEVCEKNGISFRVIGGAKLATEIDAKRAIREAWELAR